jgi:hypothetical protein
MGKLLACVDDASADVAAEFGYTSAQARILAYLRIHLGEIVGKDALAGVAGISAWARRVRELRVEHGWRISSDETRDDLRSGEYVLEAPEPDEDLAKAWQTAQQIRNLPGSSGKSRILALLKAVYPAAADKEQLGYVARIDSWQRRLREHAEEGWQVVSNVDDPSLAPGSYRLAALDQLPARARQAIKLRYEILARDHYTCHDCGWQPEHGGRTLQIHHTEHRSQSDPNRLVTLCDPCHAGRHALARGKTKDEVLNPGSDPNVTGRARPRRNG